MSPSSPEATTTAAPPTASNSITSTSWQDRAETVGHLQIGEGNLIETRRKALPWIGDVQVADVPGRCEPGTGEINYAGIARALDEVGYRGPVGMEAFAKGDPTAALDAFRQIFSV